MTESIPNVDGTVANDPLAYLYPQEFMLLTTFRKDGTPVNTAVWFASAGGKIYVTTQGGSGKIKRIRRDSKVLLAPCDRVGNVTGPQIQAFARELHDATQSNAHTLLSQKYGLHFEQIMKQGNQATRTYIEIAPVAFV